MDSQASKSDVQRLIEIFRELESICENLPRKNHELWQGSLHEQSREAKMKTNISKIEAPDVHSTVHLIHLWERSLDRNVPPLVTTRGMRFKLAREGVTDTVALDRYCRADPEYVQACIGVEKKLESFAKEIDHLLYPHRSALLKTPRFQDTLLTSDWRKIRDGFSLLSSMLGYHKKGMFLRAVDDLARIERTARQEMLKQSPENRQQSATTPPESKRENTSADQDITVNPASGANGSVQNDSAKLPARFEQAVIRVRTYVTEQRIKVPECFVSYAWSVSEHERWVEKQLATDLRKAGISVVLDRWHNAQIGGSVSRFVERIEESDRIVMVGTPLYRRKYEN
jgi:hypothetical protein